MENNIILLNKNYDISIKNVVKQIKNIIDVKKILIDKSLTIVEHENKDVGNDESNNNQKTEKILLRSASINNYRNYFIQKNLELLNVTGNKCLKELVNLRKSVLKIKLPSSEVKMGGSKTEDKKSSNGGLLNLFNSVKGDIQGILGTFEKFGNLNVAAREKLESSNSASQKSNKCCSNTLRRNRIKNNSNSSRSSRRRSSASRVIPRAPARRITGIGSGMGGTSLIRGATAAMGVVSAVAVGFTIASAAIKGVVSMIKSEKGKGNPNADKAYKNLVRIQKVFGNIKKTFINLLLPIVGNILEPIAKWMEGNQSKLKALTETVVKMFEFMMRPFIENADMIGGIFTSVIDIISTIFEVLNPVMEAISSLRSSIFGILGKITGRALRIINKIVRLLKPAFFIIGLIIKGITSVIDFIWSVLDPIYDVLESIFGFFLDGLNWMYEGIIQWIKDILSYIPGATAFFGLDEDSKKPEKEKEKAKSSENAGTKMTESLNEYTTYSTPTSRFEQEGKTSSKMGSTSHKVNKNLNSNSNSNSMAKNVSEKKECKKLFDLENIGKKIISDIMRSPLATIGKQIFEAFKNGSVEEMGRKLMKAFKESPIGILGKNIYQSFKDGSVKEFGMKMVESIKNSQAVNVGKSIFETVTSSHSKDGNSTGIQQNPIAQFTRRIFESVMSTFGLSNNENLINSNESTGNIYKNTGNINEGRIKKGQSYGDTNIKYEIAKIAETIVVREEADIEKIADSLVSKFEIAAFNMS